jgi:formylmethanofuran dehydrogenase subunit E
MVATSKEEIDLLVKEAAKLRGHLCLGLPLGVKMGMKGLRLLHMEDKANRDSLMVVVENNKCPADGIQVATGCTAGSRRLRVSDYGKSAAVFYNGESGVGYRITTKPDFLARAIKLAVDDGIITNGQKIEEFSQLERKIMMNAFTKMTEDELLDAQKVRVNGKAPRLPSLTEPKSNCSRCGEEIMDGKGVRANGVVVCDSCQYGSYYAAV